MKRSLGNGLLCILMLWVAVGMPLIHPLFHQHDFKSTGSGRHFCSEEKAHCPESFHTSPDIHSPSHHHHGFCPICHFFSHFGKFLLILTTAALAGLIFVGAIRLSVRFVFTPACLGLSLPRGPPVFR
ncbi:MAG: DUF2946 family protein [Desulfobacterales bacterium]